MGSGKGEIAIVDLVNVGIVQRIKPTLPRLKIQSLHFISHFVFVAIVNEGRDHTHVYHYSTESNNSEEAKWNRDWVYRISHRSICASLFEFEFSWLMRLGKRISYLFLERMQVRLEFMNILRFLFSNKFDSKSLLSVVYAYL